MRVLEREREREREKEEWFKCKKDMREREGRDLKKNLSQDM